MASIPGMAQWARWTPEATWGVFDGTATTTVFWTRLIDGAALKVDGAPVPQTIRGADGGNLRQQRYSKKTTYAFALKMPLYYSQASKIVPFFTTPVTIGGRKQIPSFTIDYWDGAEERRCLGARIAEGDLASDNESDTVMLTASGMYKKLGTPVSLTEPASTLFPSEIPFCHQDAFGQLDIGGAQANFKSIKGMWKNILKANFNESPYLTGLDYCGRDVSFQATVELADSARRALYENQTQQTSGKIGWSVTIAGPTTHAVLADFQGNCYLTNRDVNRDFTDNQYEALTIDAFKDQSAGTDCVVTVS